VRRYDTYASLVNNGRPGGGGSNRIARRSLVFSAFAAESLVAPETVFNALIEGIAYLLAGFQAESAGRVVVHRTTFGNAVARDVKVHIAHFRVPAARKRSGRP
jgi:hypothetical protein